MIRKCLNFCIQYQVGVVSYCIRGKDSGDTWELVIIVFNANREGVSVPIPEGKFRIIAREDEIDENGLGTFSGEKITVAPISMLVLAK
jgi:pullulanase